MASYTAVAPAYKPRYDFQEGLAALGVPGLDVAWYTQDRATVRERQSSDEAVFEAVWQAQIDSNQGRDETTYVAQTGALADWAASARGEPVCDPAAIDAPTLVVRGSADEIADRPGTIEYYDDLDAPGDRADYVEIQGADHYLMHSDRRRDFFRTVHDFQTRVG